MKHTNIVILAALIGLLIPASSAFSTSCHSGDHIHMSNVRGYSLSYELIDMTENIKKLKGEHAKHAAMIGSHHLMVSVKGPTEGKAMKVGFIVIDPDGKEHKAMAMEMGGGFGADVPMMKKGTYTIKTKIVAGETKFVDEFSHHMK